MPYSLTAISGSIKEFSIEDWTKDFSANLVDNSQYQFHYKGEKYKIFTNGNSLEVNGWISGQRYKPDECFYLAVSSSLFQKVEKWGEKGCEEFKHLEDFAGLPENWQLFKIKGVKDDCLIKNDIPALAIDENSKICFENGIRIGRGNQNQFFNFAPPQIEVIKGRDQNLELFYEVNNEKKPLIHKNGESRLFLLPQNIPCNKWITIELETNDPSKKAKSKLMLSRTSIKKIC